MKSFLKYIGIWPVTIQIGKKYINESDVGSFYPLIFTPIKINKTNVLYEWIYMKFPDSEPKQDELSIRLFKAFYIPYEP